MLKLNQKALQVFKNDNWEYVFCYNHLKGIVTTKDRHKSLNAQYDLDYFRNKYGNDLFRAEKNGGECLA
jgi:hypothetical protein